MFDSHCYKQTWLRENLILLHAYNKGAYQPVHQGVLISMLLFFTIPENNNSSALFILMNYPMHVDKISMELPIFVF